MAVMVDDQTCPLSSPAVISTAYIDPNVVMVSWLEETIDSSDESPILLVYGLNADGATATEMQLHFEVSLTHTHILTKINIRRDQKLTFQGIYVLL